MYVTITIFVPPHVTNFDLKKVFVESKFIKCKIKMTQTYA